MKKLFFSLIAFCGLTMYSCHKTGDAPPPILSISGTWHYIGYGGGIAGLHFQPVDTVEAYIQADTVNMRILSNYNGQQGCTTYTFMQTIIGCFGPPSAAFTGAVTLSNPIPMGAGTQYAISITHDTLVVQQATCIDCPLLYYVLSSRYFDWCVDAPAGK